MAATPQDRSTTTDREARPVAPPLNEQAAPAAAGRPGRAVAALVLGIVSIPAALFPIAAWIFGVVAIVLGVTARSDIRRRGLDGDGMATAGIVCAIVGVVLGVANVVAALTVLS